MNRRDVYRYGTAVLGSLVALALGVPGVAYLADPLRRRTKAGGFTPLAKLDELPVGAPQAFAIVDERQDAWVKYPREPIGSVWLVRQPEGSKVPVVAFTTECPHLGCAVNLSADGTNFFCPCHTSSFDFSGKPLNAVPPRGMDTLEVRVTDDARVEVRFRRFRTQSEEKIPLA